MSLDDSVKSGSKSARSKRTKSPKREKSPARTSKTKKGRDDSTAPSKKFPSKKSTKRSDLSVRSADKSSITPENVLDVIPAEYYRNPEPILHYLPRSLKTVTEMRLPVLEADVVMAATLFSSNEMATGTNRRMGTEVSWRKCIPIIHSSVPHTIEHKHPTSKTQNKALPVLSFTIKHPKTKYVL